MIEMKLEPMLESDLKDTEEANIIKHIILNNMISDFAFAHLRGKELVLSSSLPRDELDFIKNQLSRYNFLSYNEYIDEKTGKHIRCIKHHYEESAIETNATFFELDKTSFDDIMRHVSNFPVRMKKDINQNPMADRPKYYVYPLDATEELNSPILEMSTVPKVPKSSKFTRSSIVEQNSTGLLRNIQVGRVIFVKGNAGCGKSTMLPNILLEESAKDKKAVRIISTSPRDLSVVARAKYLSAMRGETLGSTIGYHIRLERSISPCNTIMTFCSSFVLLKTLTNPNLNGKFFENVTHVIVDDINERDKHTDLLLVCLRDAIQVFPKLKIIILGTEFDEEPLLRIFSGVHYIPRVELKREYNLKRVIHLQEILASTEFSQLVKKVDEEEGDQNGFKDCKAKSIYENAETLMKESWSGDRMAAEKFIRMIEADQIEVDFNVGNGITLVMICGIHNWMPELLYLAKLGADLTSMASSGETALTLAEKAGMDETAAYFRTAVSRVGTGDHNHLFNVKKIRLLESKVDINFVFEFLIKILHDNPASSVLVFLASYPDIITLKSLMGNHPIRPSINVFIVHPKMEIKDYEVLFKTTRKRRVILTTEFGENHLPIPFEIGIVIDVGKNRERVFDEESNTHEMRDCWISSVAAISRAQKSGYWGQGTTYRLYTQETFVRMNEFPVPEIQRISLEGIVLLARSLSYEKCLERFFERLPSPPSVVALRLACELLQQMDAFDERCCLTSLGTRLLEFPLEPHLGKALLYSTVFRCVDPILTIVSALSEDDLFQIPQDENERRAALSKKMSFTHSSYSDLAALIYAFQSVEASKTYDRQVERTFCDRNYISASMFEIIYSTRTKLFGQLRVSGYIRSKGIDHLREVNVYSANWALIKGVIAAAFFPKVAPITPTGRIYDPNGNTLHFNPHSVLNNGSMRQFVLNKNNSWIVFEQHTKTRFTKEIRNCSVISPPTVAIFCGNYVKDTVMPDPKSDRFKMILSNGSAFLGAQNEMQGVSLFREKVFHLAKNWIENPWHYLNKEEMDIFLTLNYFLGWEEARRGLGTVVGLNTWPLFVTGDILNTVLENVIDPSDLIDCVKDRYFLIKISKPEDLTPAFLAKTWVATEDFKINVFPFVTPKVRPLLFFWDEQGDKVHAFAELLDIKSNKMVELAWISKTAIYPDYAFAKEWIDYCEDGFEMDTRTGEIISNMFYKAEEIANALELEECLGQLTV